MNTLTTKLTVTALAALICATPVSLDLVRPNAGQEAAAHFALSLNTAQARPMRFANIGHGNLGFGSTGNSNLGFANTGNGNIGQEGRQNGAGGFRGGLRAHLGQSNAKLGTPANNVFTPCTFGHDGRASCCW